jgi:hypothetical protein
VETVSSCTVMAQLALVTPMTVSAAIAAVAQRAAHLLQRQAALHAAALPLQRQAVLRAAAPLLQPQAAHLAAHQAIMAALANVTGGELCTQAATIKLVVGAGKTIKAASALALVVAKASMAAA